MKQPEQHGSSRAERKQDMTRAADKLKSDGWKIVSKSYRYDLRE